MNSSYKKWHKPNQLESAKTSQGYYHPKNRDKYVGDTAEIVYRSSWEFAFCKFCDFSPSVRRWSSEPIRVPYYDRVSNLNECRKYGLNPNNPKNWKVRYYHTDFWVELMNADQVLEKWFVEIKPAKDLMKPAAKGNMKGRALTKYNKLVKTYLINEAKFAAMDEWVKRRGAKFYVLTENELPNIIGRFWHL